MDKSKYGSLHKAVALRSVNSSEEDFLKTKMDAETGPTEQAPISFADMGIPPAATLQDTMIGMARPVSEITWKERIYVILMLISIIAAALFTIYRVSTVGTTDNDFTFGLVLLLNAVFCIWFVIEGVWRERPSELVILSFATVIIMVYIIANYAAGAKNDVKLARLVVACTFCPVLVVLGLSIAWRYHEEKHLIFRTVGANEHLQTLYRNLLAFQDFLKFDLQLGGSMVILIVVPQFSVSTRDIVILAVGGPVTLAWFILGFITMPREWKIWAYIFFLFSPVEIAYVIYKLYDVSQYLHVSPGLADATIACGIAAILVRVVVIIVGIFVFRAFGEGLKEKVQSS